MQRPHATPPIHHPVPQRPVQVPQMQSPPPPQPQSAGPYDSNPYGSYAQPPQQTQQYGQFPGAQSFGGGGGAGNFFTDPMTAHMGFNVARAAMAGSSDLAEKNITRYLSSVKPFFAVTNLYVLRKLQILLLPWRHTPWSRHSTSRASTSRPGEVEAVYLPPRDDLNAPDMYIPVMSFVSYILLCALLHGVAGSFHPELLGYTASSALGAVILEIAGIKLGCYLLSIGGSQLLDLVAYSGYKFVGVAVSVLCTALVGRGAVSWGVFVYVYAANAFFLLRSLKYVLLPEEGAVGDMGQTRGMRKRRTWFLFTYSYGVQLLFMLFLASGMGGN